MNFIRNDVIEEESSTGSEKSVESDDDDLSQ